MSAIFSLVLAASLSVGSVFADADFRQQVRDLTNAQRANSGLAALIKHNQLDRAAQKFAEAMAKEDFYDHEGPDGSKPWDRAQREGYVSGFVGENIAAGYVTSADVMDGWMNSAGHRANILKPEYKAIGVGYFEIKPDTGNVQYERYWVQLFGDETAGADQGNDGRNAPTPGDPAVSKPKVVKGAQGSPMRLRLGRSGEIASFEMTGTLPKGVKFNRKKGIFRGTPQQSGKFVAFVRGRTDTGTTNRVRVVMRVRAS